MNSRHVALVAAAAAWSLQGCNTAYTRDILERSTSRATLPLAGVRLPPNGDTGVLLQASFAFKAQRSGPHSIQLDHGAGEADYSIETRDANSTLTMPQGQAAGMANLWVNPRFRVGLAVDAGSSGGTFGLETAIRLGDPLSIEVFAGAGVAHSSSNADWRIETTQHDEEEGGTDTTIQRNSGQGSRNGGYGLLGCHVGARRDGPWVEGVLLRQVLFDAWSAGNEIWFDAVALGAGWSIFTDHGAVTLFGRALHLGTDWSPSAGVQFTVELGSSGSPGGRGDAPARNRWKGAMPP